MNPEFLPFDLPVCDARQHALVHASVLTMADERVLADHTVVVEAGRIRTIGPSYDIDTAGMQVFDCRSRFVMPGLADLYTHYWDPADSPLYLAAGVTTVRTVCVPFQLALSKLAERGEFPSPRMVTLSPPIDGVNAQGRTDMPRGVAMTDASQAQALIRRFVASGYDQIKGFSLLAPDNLRALCSAARDAGIRVTTNCPNAMRFEDAIEAGVHCLDQLHNVARGHLRAGAPEPPFWDRFDPVPGTRLDFDAIQRLGGLLAERDVWNVPTLVFHQRDGLPPAEGLRDPDLRYVSAQSIEDWDATLGRWTKRAAMTDADAWRAAARDRARAFVEVVRIFAAEGAPLLTGTDSLNPWNVPGRSLHTELANFVAAGMRPFEALQCATVAAARFLCKSDESGTLAPGKRADFVVLDVNPLESLTALDRIAAVGVNGWVLARSELNRLLDARAGLVAAPPRLPALTLRDEPPLNEVSLVSTGQWQEHIIDTPSGRVEFRHARRADGGWLIDEQHATSVPRRHVERRNAHLILAKDFTIESATLSIETFAGTESAAIRYQPESARYVLEGLDLLGVKIKGQLATPPLWPSERLTATLWPIAVAHLQRATLDTNVLDVDGDALVARRARIAPEGAHDWLLRIDRPTHASGQQFNFDAGGLFLGMDEMMPLAWPRTLRPA